MVRKELTYCSTLTTGENASLVKLSKPGTEVICLLCGGSELAYVKKIRDSALNDSNEIALIRRIIWSASEDSSSMLALDLFPLTSLKWTSCKYASSTSSPVMPVWVLSATLVPSWNA
jgi:hypothetical protein